MDIPDEALSNFLMNNGLTDPKWVSYFHEHDITKPDQIPVKGNEELYMTLSSRGNAQEKVDLKKALGITDCPEKTADSIQIELDKVGLDPSYWSAVFAKQLGVTSTQALQNVGDEEYPTLKQFARHSWEKKALQSLLKLDDEGGTFLRQYEKRRERLENRQAESKEMLKHLKILQEEGKERHDQEVQSLENGIRERFQIPSESWLSKDETLSYVISKLEECHERIDGHLRTREELSGVSVIQNASAGLALQGVLLTKNLQDQLQPRHFLLKVCGDIQLLGPSHPQQDKIQQFTSKQDEHDFTQTVDRLGYSVTASAKAGYWGFPFEASLSFSKTREEEQKSKHNRQDNYSSTVKYSIMPLAACYLSDSQLQLSDEAIKHLQKIEKLVDSRPESFKEECRIFFNKFGSHVNQGPLHFGGRYQWKSYSRGFKQSDTATVQQLQTEAIDLQVGMSYGSFAAASTAVSASSLHDKFWGKYSDTMMGQTFLEVTKSGGPPEVSGLPEWKNGLVASNSTWSLIDRGAKLVSVWDIITMNHTKDFQKPESLGIKLSEVWKQMNGYTERAEDKQQKDAAQIMEEVKIWNDNHDMSECIDHLASLVKVKQDLARESIDPKAWSFLYLSKPPLQQFLKLVVESCEQPTSPINESSERIKLYMQELVEPINLGADIHFPSREYICRWLYATEKSFVPMDCQDFPNLQKHFQYALHHMYDCMTRGDAKLMELADQPDINCSIKLTATVAKAVSSLRYHLHKAEQNYEDLFITTMLFPFKYDPDKGTFLTLLSTCDLKYLCKEFENQSKEFFRIGKEENEMKLQAYLLWLAIQMQKNLDVTECQIKSHLKFTEEKLGSGIDSEVQEVLSELSSKHYDWKWFEIQLKSILESSVFPEPEGGSQSFRDFVATIEEPKCVPQKDRPLPDVQERNKQSRQLFSMLGLTDYFPQKLTLRHALEIREDTLLTKKDFHQETDDNGTHKQVQCTDPKLFPFDILQKIMAFDYKSRTKFIYSLSATKESIISTDKMPDQDSVQADNVDSEEEDDDKDDETVTIHPMDGLLALLHCSDNFLRQDLFSRLATCQLAIPLLMPDPFAPQIIFPLWAMRSIVKEWKCTQTSVSHEEALISYRAPLVSFMRFGKHHVSKSRVLNAVISESNHDIFFHFNCDGGSAPQLLVGGLVEVCWYLPSDDIFPDVVSFANLHGDARQFSKQVSFLSKVSFMNFVFLNDDNLDSEAFQVLIKLAKAPGGLIILQTKPTADKKVLQKHLKPLKESVSKEKYSVIKLLNCNEAEITDAVRRSINEKWKAAAGHFEQFSNIAHSCSKDNSAKDEQLAIVVDEEEHDCANGHCYTFEEFSNIAHTCNEDNSAKDDKLAIKIIVDEEENDCASGKELADGFKKYIDDFMSLHPGRSIKELLPLQSSDLWQKWAFKNKEQYRHTLRGHHGIEEYGEQQRKQMKLIRIKQSRHLKHLTPLTKLFVRTILSHEGRVRKYFLHSLQLILDNLSRKQLPDIRTQYRQKRGELQNILAQEIVNDSAEKVCQHELDELSRMLIESTFGLEHLLRETCQIYEAIRACENEPGLDKQMFRLPAMAAELMIDGYPLELMDGDAAHVPKTWVLAVLNEVQERLNDPRVLVLSILGLQGTGKSTLMNAMFGLRFSVSAGRCTRGAFMQLLPVHAMLKQECNCDYLLIVDSEGLRSPELDSLQAQKHDNELATFIIGLANLTVINIRGETTGDLDDILQTAVHAFLRMKEVKLVSNCRFVHHNVAAVMAGEKGMMGRIKFKEKLNEMTLAAAKEENLDGQYKSFSQIMEFNEEDDVYYFPGLWKGDPPMAPVNPGYSKKAQEMKLQLINFTKVKSASTPLSVFRRHMKELWKAVLQENFVFSFKNTVEIAAYNTLDAKYGQWSWSFQHQMMQWEQKAQNELRSCTRAELPRVYERLTSELPRHVQNIYQNLKESLETWFEESPEREIVSKWKSGTEIRLRNLCTQLQTRAESHCKQIITSRQALAKIDEMKVSHRRRMMEHVKLLASQLEQRTLNDEELEQRFNEQWIGWITELRAIPVHMADICVHADVEKSLTETFHSHTSQVIEKLSNKPLRKWGYPLKLIINSELHMKAMTFTTAYLKTTRIAKAVGFKWSEKCLLLAQEITDEILEKVHVYLTEKRNGNYNPMFTNELLHILSEEIDTFNSRASDFKFTPDYRVDIAMTACGYALKKFEQMEESYRKKLDPVEYLGEMRGRFLELFKHLYLQVAQEKAAAITLCGLLSKSLKQQVISSLSHRIVDDMRGKIPHFHSKPALKTKILLDIGEQLHQNGSFAHCALYLKDIKRSLQWWIKHYTRQHCEQGEPSRLVQLAMVELSALIICIDQTTQEVTQDISPEQEEFSINEWLSKFHGKLQGRLEIDVTELRDLGGAQQLKDIHNFNEEVTKGLQKLEAMLKEEFLSSMDVSAMDQWERKPYDIIFKNLAGCTEQCPFCGEQCELTNESHLPSTKHSVVMHRPKCLCGYRNFLTKQMSLTVCTFSVGSDGQFRNRVTEQKPHPYKKYSALYPNWAIPADMSFEASSYWKWLVAHYTREILELFHMKETEIPQEWKELRWDCVRNDLEHMY